MGDVRTRPPIFRTVDPEQERCRNCHVALFSPRKCVKTVIWSHSVNSEEFLIAEANIVEIQSSLTTRCASKLFQIELVLQNQSGGMPHQFTHCAARLGAIPLSTMRVPASISNIEISFAILCVENTKAVDALGLSARGRDFLSHGTARKPEPHFSRSLGVVRVLLFSTPKTGVGLLRF